MDKKKLTIDEQVTHMKNNGILFNVMDEDAAKKYLTENSYYFRLKAYAKNFDRYRSSNKAGQYINLEFAYLAELSVLDFHFRRIILHMTINIEHYMKQHLLVDIGKEPSEDGYSIVHEAFSNKEIDSIISEKKNYSACRDLVLKYENNWAVWNIIEVISFSNLIKLHETFYEKYSSYKNIKIYARSIRYLRNAAAHNNCLLNSLKQSYTGGPKFQYTKSLYNKLANAHITSNATLSKNMRNPVIHDFISLLFAYGQIVTSDKVKKNDLNELSTFINKRCLKNKTYFKNNEIIINKYKFIKKVIDYLELQHII